MAMVVLAGVLGTVLVVGGTAGDTEQAGSSSPAPVVSAAPRSLASPPGFRPTESFHGLFTAPGTPTAAGRPVREVRFGEGARPSAQPVQGVGRGCRPNSPSNEPSVDPGIYMPPRDTHVNFTIRRIVPSGCVDPGIIAPKPRK